jgi:hypothetical protein
MAIVLTPLRMQNFKTFEIPEFSWLRQAAADAAEAAAAAAAAPPLAFAAAAAAAFTGAAAGFPSTTRCMMMWHEGRLLCRVIM